jgi:CheY-like chemotaxis protein
MKTYHATIMVVEDDRNDQFLIERALRKIGVTDPIQLVNNGEEAIAYMKGEGRFADRAKFAYPTFVITDLKMPKGDGFSVLQFLKSNPEWKVIPTIVLSASADPDDIKCAYTLGASSYHIKPRTNDELNHQMSVIHAYWLTCQVPQVDSTGKQLPTDSKGKLGERFDQPSDESESGSKPT